MNEKEIFTMREDLLSNCIPYTIDRAVTQKCSYYPDILSRSDMIIFEAWNGRLQAFALVILFCLHQQALIPVNIRLLSHLQPRMGLDVLHADACDRVLVQQARNELFQRC